MNMVQLRALAKENNLRGYSRLRKADLINFINESMGSTRDPSEHSHKDEPPKDETLVPKEQPQKDNKLTKRQRKQNAQKASKLSKTSKNL